MNKAYNKMVASPKDSAEEKQPKAPKVHSLTRQIKSRLQSLVELTDDEYAPVIPFPSTMLTTRLQVVALCPQHSKICLTRRLGKYTMTISNVPLLSLISLFVALVLVRGAHMSD